MRFCCWVKISFSPKYFAIFISSASRPKIFKCLSHLKCKEQKLKLMFKHFYTRKFHERSVKTMRKQPAGKSNLSFPFLLISNYSIAYIKKYLLNDHIQDKRKKEISWLTRSNKSNAIKMIVIKSAIIEQTLVYGRNPCHLSSRYNIHEGTSVHQALHIPFHSPSSVPNELSVIPSIRVSYRTLKLAEFFSNSKIQ